MERMLKIGEVAKLLGVSPQTLRRWNKSGKLKAKRLSSTSYYYYLESEITAWQLRDATAVDELQQFIEEKHCGE